MSTQKIFKSLRKAFPSDTSSKSNQEIAESISKSLISSTSFNLPQITSPLFTNLNPQITHLVLSNPWLSIQSCLYFFNFLQQNHAVTSQKPDLQAHLTLICRLFKARKFAEARNFLDSAIVDDNVRHPVPVITTMVEGLCDEKKVIVKLFDMLFRVYSDNRILKEALDVFDYMKNKGLEIDERSCIVYLLALRNSNQVHSLLSFFSSNG